MEEQSQTVYVCVFLSFYLKIPIYCTVLMYGNSSFTMYNKKQSIPGTYG